MFAIYFLTLELIGGVETRQRVEGLGPIGSIHPDGIVSFTYRWKSFACHNRTQAYHRYREHDMYNTRARVDKYVIEFGLLRKRNKNWI